MKIIFLQYKDGEILKSQPTLFSYVVRYDDGAAPNPYGGVCTLVICKPVIRRTAEKGDWIVGLGSKSNPVKKDYSGRIVYVMKITEKMTMKEYDEYTKERLPEKIPDLSSADKYRRLGDSIYNFSLKGIPQRPGVHKRKNRKTDMSGKFALLSKEFVYFGDQTILPPPSLKGILHSYRGHRSTMNGPYVNDFLAWWKTNRTDFASRRVRGEPQCHFGDLKNCNACAAGRRRCGK